MRNLVSDVETIYWELYYAFRDLDAKIAARDRALQMWRSVNALMISGRRGGEPEKEAQAREQYYRLEEDVQNALAGRIQESSRATTFRGAGGIYNNERRLRLLIGLPINDGRLIRPSTEPTIADVQFVWEEILAEALTRRVELRRQKWRIKQRELELKAAKNYLYPELDLIGRYRWRGLGNKLLEPNGNGRPPFHDAFGNLVDGDFEEWQLGFEFAFPVGFRQAHAAVRNAQLNLSREHAVLKEQEREVTHDVSNTVAEKNRAYRVAKTNYNRRTAALTQLRALEATYLDADESQKGRLFDLLLDSQRRLADAESRYYRSTVEYMLAIKQVHYNKGSLLNYNEVYLAEGPWPKKAYVDAAQRDRMRMKNLHLDNFITNRSPTVSRGTYPQKIVPGPRYLPPTDSSSRNELPPPPNNGN